MKRTRHSVKPQQKRCMVVLDLESSNLQVTTKFVIRHPYLNSPSRSVLQISLFVDALTRGAPAISPSLSSQHHHRSFLSVLETLKRRKDFLQGSCLSGNAPPVWGQPRHLLYLFQNLSLSIIFQLFLCVQSLPSLRLSSLPAFLHAHHSSHCSLASSHVY